MAERPREAIEKRIAELTKRHRAFDPLKPPKAWEDEWSDAQVDRVVFRMLDAYEAAAPHLSRACMLALRNLLRAHPKLRLRGDQSKQAPNYRIPTGKKFYWGGVRRKKDGHVMPGGVGPRPQVLVEYEASPSGRKRVAAGKATFEPLD